MDIVLTMVYLHLLPESNAISVVIRILRGKRKAEGIIFISQFAYRCILVIRDR